MRGIRPSVTVTRALGVLLVLGVLITLTGCATIVDGGPGTVMINSNPAGAAVTVTDKYGNMAASGQTPCTLRLDRGAGFFSRASYSVQVAMPGYSPQQMQITSSLNTGWYIVGNFFIGGLIGWFVVDPLSGAMWGLDQNQFYAALVPQAMGPPSAVAPPPVVAPPAAPPEQPSTGPVCPGCGFRNTEGAKFCAKCGQQLPVEQFCPGCGQKYEAGAKFCPSCGKQL